jgi:two-component system response regulator
MAPDAAPSTIVLVEDNPDDAHLALIELDDAGVRNEIVLLDDGEQALRYLRAQDPFAGAPPPGLVLLDLHLPKLDGHEVLQAIDADADAPRVPIVVVSVPTELTWVQEEYGHLIAGVLPKPILIGPLRETLATIDGLGTGFLVTHPG